MASAAADPAPSCLLPLAGTHLRLFLQPQHQAAVMPPASSRGTGWGSLTEDLVCGIAALLPVRDRCGSKQAEAAYQAC